MKLLGFAALLMPSRARSSQACATRRGFSELFKGWDGSTINQTEVWRLKDLFEHVAFRIANGLEPSYVDSNEEYRSMSSIVRTNSVGWLLNYLS